MHKAHSLDDKESELTLAQLNFQKQSSEPDNSGYEVLQLQNNTETQVNEQSQEERIEKQLQKRYSIEDRIYLIVNKQTGEVFDSRNDQIVDNLLRRNTITPHVKSEWSGYWKNINIAHQKYIEAATRGDLAALQKLLNGDHNQLPIDPNYKTFDAWTALHHACFNNSVECARFLLSKNAQINLKSKFGWTALHITAKQNCVETAKVLIDNKADLNPQDNEFYTPLHYAAECGFVDMVKLLLNAGADQKIRNCQGRFAKDCSQNINIFTLFRDSDQQLYSKAVFGGVLLPNSRTDHIQRFLSFKKVQNQDEESEKKAQKKDSKPVNKFVNIIKMYQALELKKNEAVSVNDFTFYKLLGRGSFGEVYLVKKNSDDKLYAMKVLRKEKVVGTSLSRYIQTEKDVLSFVSHPFIVRLHYAFQSQSRLFLIMQFCQGGDLSKVIESKKKFSQEVARIYICEIVLALEALHKNMVIYRDLKPENLVLDENGHVMITDFGLSKKGEIDKINSSFCGTPAYLAPEILDKKGHNRMADWYEMGVVLYEFLVGTPPFYATSREQLYKNKRQNILKIPKNLSEDCKDLIVKLLNKDPNKRLGIEKDGQSIREHPWFKGIDWQKVYNRELKPPVYNLIKVNLNNPMVIRFPEGTQNSKHMPEWSFVA